MRRRRRCGAGWRVPPFARRPAVALPQLRRGARPLAGGLRIMRCVRRINWRMPPRRRGRSPRQRPHTLRADAGNPAANRRRTPNRRPRLWRRPDHRPAASRGGGDPRAPTGQRPPHAVSTTPTNRLTSAALLSGPLPSACGRRRHRRRSRCRRSRCASAPHRSAAPSDLGAPQDQRLHIERRRAGSSGGAWRSRRRIAARGAGTAHQLAVAPQRRRQAGGIGIGGAQAALHQPARRSRR